VPGVRAGGGWLRGSEKGFGACGRFRRAPLWVAAKRGRHPGRR
jgi:hypothetical protein